MRTSAAFLFLFVAACSVQQATEPGKNSDPANVPYKKLNLAYDKAVVGAEVHFACADLPPGKTVDLQWGTVEGGWVIENYYHFKGKKYTETTASFGKFNIDSSG